MATSPRFDRGSYRLAVAALLCAVPLVLFGGSVTTLGAGMAVEGWLIAEGHFLLFFPIDSWLRDVGTFVEHTHRLFGMLVGAVAVAACVRAWIKVRSTGAWFATAALVAVILQGALGGFRVLEDSPQLAFLHGVFAQATFGLLAASAVVLSARWSAGAEGRASDESADGMRRLRAIALVTAVVVFGQVFLGAWYRHGLRPTPAPGIETRLALHFAGAAVAFFAVVVLAAVLLRAARSTSGARATALTRAARNLRALLGVQIALGLFAWVGFRPGAIGPMEWGLSILHVLCGALLFAQCGAAVLWSVRLAGRRAQERYAVPASGLPEGAR
ncbi:MAG: COX15/CtaA family protein [Planctomycetota bacterium]